MVEGWEVVSTVKPLLLEGCLLSNDLKKEEELYTTLLTRDIRNPLAR